jgi:hypothetical protein
VAPGEPDTAADPEAWRPPDDDAEALATDPDAWDEGAGEGLLPAPLHAATITAKARPSMAAGIDLERRNIGGPRLLANGFDRA